MRGDCLPQNSFRLGFSIAPSCLQRARLEGGKIRWSWRAGSLPGWKDGAVSGALWVVRAGEGARYADEFRLGSYIAVGFEDVADDDLSQQDESAVRMRGTTPG